MSPTFVGSYELVEPIGHGGMGEVWLARHKSLRRLVAVKLIRPEALSSGSADEARRRFEHEAHAMSALRSPHTVALLDYGTTDGGDVYYAMELLQGISLATLVADFGPVAPERAVHLLSGMCESLAEAHERGLVHRDVKPANVFACVLGGKYDFVKVLDFGLVRTIPALDEAASPTVTGTIAGSPAFLAPEAVRGVVAPSCDIYGLGCVGYWLLTGKLVFEGQTALEIILAHAQREPVPPSVRSGMPVPARLEKLVLDCLAKDPAARPKSVVDIAETLEACPLDARWTAARARRFFEDHREALARTNPAMQRVHELAPRIELPPLKRERVQASLDQLQHHFTRSHIDVSELELRMLRVKKAKSVEEIERVFADLPPLRPGETPAAHAPLAAEIVAESGATKANSVAPLALAAPPFPLARGATVVSVMSSHQRHLSLRDGDIHKVVSVMGEANIYVDGSQFSGGVAELRCVAVMGHVTVQVGSGFDVEANGVGVLGAFEHWGTRRQTAGRQRLLITGVAVMGLVKIVVAPE